MRTATAVLLIAALVVLGGVAALGTVFSGDTGVTIDERWVSDTGRDVQANHHAVAAGRIGTASGERGMVYAPVSGRSKTPTCALYGLDARSGASEWRYDVPARDCTIHSVADPALTDYDDDGAAEVLAATTEDALVALDPETGAEELRVNLSDYGYTSPRAVDLVGDDAKELVIVDIKGTVVVADANGSIVWTHRLESQTWGQPAIADFDDDGAPELLIGTDGGELVLFEGDGEVVWRDRDAVDGSITWMSTGQADDDPAPEVAIATHSGDVTLLEGATGERRWSHNFGKFAAVEAFGDGDGDGQAEVYAVAKDGTLRSISAASGDVEWTTTLTTESVNMMPPPVLGDLDGDGSPDLLAVTNDGRVAVVDPTTGDISDSYDREVPIYAPARLVDTDGDGRDEAYVIYSDGRVVAFEAASDN